MCFTVLCTVPVHTHAACEQTLLSNNRHRPYNTGGPETRQEAEIVSVSPQIGFGEASGESAFVSQAFTCNSSTTSTVCATPFQPATRYRALES